MSVRTKKSAESIACSARRRMSKEAFQLVVEGVSYPLVMYPILGRIHLCIFGLMLIDQRHVCHFFNQLYRGSLSSFEAIVDVDVDSKVFED